MNETEKLQRQLKNIYLTTAADFVLEAVENLTEAKKNAQDYGDIETIEHFRHQLMEFLSCDNGEAGFMPYVTKVASK